MKVENGKIVEATEIELWNWWYTHNWCEMMSFPEYIRQLGDKVKIKEEKE